MTIVRRRADDRGLLALEWIESRFTFSFGDYYDPRHLGFGALRALNEHRLSAGSGFDRYRRSDLEILTYVCGGALRYQDSLGHDVVLNAGGLQRLSAGSGAEYWLSNNSDVDPARFVQIWVLPEEDGGAPSYEASAVDPTRWAGGLRLLASQDGRDGALTLKRAVDLYAGALRGGDGVVHPLGRDREAWVQVLAGAITVEGEALRAGDGLGLVDVEVLRIDASDAAEILLFDMARD